jgi:hypothetical protein
MNLTCLSLAFNDVGKNEHPCCHLLTPEVIHLSPYTRPAQICQSFRGHLGRVEAAICFV